MTSVATPGLDNAPTTHARLLGRLGPWEGPGPVQVEDPGADQASGTRP